MSRTSRGFADEDVTQALQYGFIAVINVNGEETMKFPFLGKALIGRVEGCDIRVNLPYVSRKHALIAVDENGQVVLENLCKNAGMTLLNHEAFEQRAVLAHGDVFTIVDRRFRWLRSEECLKADEECISAQPRLKSALRNNPNVNNAKTLGTPQSKQEKKNDEIDEIFSAIEPKKRMALPTPLRHAIQVKAQQKEETPSQRTPTPHPAADRKKMSLPTPLRKSIEKADRSEQSAVVMDAKPAQENKSLPTPLKKAIQGKDKSVSKKALDTPLRQAIISKRPISPVAVSCPAPPQNNNAEQIETVSAKPKVALPTPLREQIKSKAAGRATCAPAHPCADEALAEAEAAARVGSVAEQDRVPKKALSTPVREQIKAGFKKTAVQVQAKMTLPTPLRKDIATRAEQVPRQQARAALPTPLRKDIAIRAEKVTHQKPRAALPTPLKNEIKEARPVEKSGALRKGLATPIRKQIVAGTTLTHVKTPMSSATFSALPASARDFLLKRSGSGEETLLEQSVCSGDESFDSEGSDDMIEREVELKSSLRQLGADPERFKDWSLEDLEQRVRSLRMEDRMVPAEEFREEEGDYEEGCDKSEDEQVLVTPQKIAFQGMRTEFATPGASPDYENYAVHWTYSDYEGSVGGESTSTASAKELEESLQVEELAEKLESTSAASAKELEESLHVEELAERLESTTLVVVEEHELAREDSAEDLAKVDDISLEEKEDRVQALALEARVAEVATEEDKTPQLRRTPRRKSQAPEKEVVVQEATPKRTPRRTPRKASSAVKVVSASDDVVLGHSAEEHFTGLKVAELRELLKEYSLDTKGRKAELVSRLVEHFEALDLEQRRQMLRASLDGSKGATADDDDEEEEEHQQSQGEEGLAPEPSKAGQSGQAFPLVIPGLLKVAELREQLHLRGLDCKPTLRKAELVEMLQGAIIEQERMGEERSAEGELFLTEKHEMLWAPLVKDDCYAMVVGFLPATEEDPYELFRIRYIDGAQVEDLERDELDSAVDAFVRRNGNL